MLFSRHHDSDERDRPSSSIRPCPAHVIGIISLVILAIALVALYGRLRRRCAPSMSSPRCCALSQCVRLRHTGLPESAFLQVCRLSLNRPSGGAGRRGPRLSSAASSVLAVPVPVAGAGLKLTGCPARPEVCHHGPVPAIKTFAGRRFEAGWMPDRPEHDKTLFTRRSRDFLVELKAALAASSAGELLARRSARAAFGQTASHRACRAAGSPSGRVRGIAVRRR